MEKTFYVVIAGTDPSLSWRDKTDKAERFSSYKAAEKRALALAKGSPGDVVEVVATVAVVRASVNKPAVARIGAKEK